MALLLVEFGPEAGELLSIIGLFVGFSSDALSCALFVIEPKGDIDMALWNNGNSGATDFFPCSFCHRSMYSF